jgi:transcriptional regulator with XRE-family HTH domain
MAKRLLSSASVRTDRITPAQIRAARGLLDWTREILSKRSGISPRTLASLETASEISTTAKTMQAVRDALEDGGVSFIEGGVQELIKVTLKAKPGQHAIPKYVCLRVMTTSMKEYSKQLSPATGVKKAEQ